MLQRVCFQIDLTRLAARLAAEWGRKPLFHEVQQWLSANRLRRSGGSWWQYDGETIACLRPDEVIRQMRLETENGVTIVEPPGPQHSRGPTVIDNSMRAGTFLVARRRPTRSLA